MSCKVCPVLYFNGVIVSYAHSTGARGPLRVFLGHLTYLVVMFIDSEIHLLLLPLSSLKLSWMLELPHSTKDNNSCDLMSQNLANRRLLLPQWLHCIRLSA
jgi:hypothetical protein